MDTGVPDFLRFHDETDYQMLNQTPGPLFTKRTDVLPKDLVKSRKLENSG